MNDVKKIKTSNFKIENNIISFNDSLLQISNISQVDVAPIPKIKINLLIVIIAGIIGLVTYENYSFGILALIFAIGYPICIYLINESNKEKRYLNVSLNSGYMYCICCDNKKFLENVRDVIEYCINNHWNQSIQIDFNKCKLHNSPVIVGNKNEVEAR